MFKAFSRYLDTIIPISKLVIIEIMNFTSVSFQSM